MAKYFNTSISNLAYRLRKFKPILEQCLREELERHEKEIVDMIRSQLQLGITGFEEFILPPYSQRTIERKLKKGQPIDRVTLYDTGKFYESLQIEFTEKGFRIVSDSQYSTYLLAKYGEEVLRLTNEHLTELLKQYIRPNLTKKLKEYLNERA